MAVLLFAVYSTTAPQNHSEAEDVYDFALQVEQGTFAEQAGVNRVLALPIFGTAYRAAQNVGYSGRAFPFMIIVNRLLAVFCLYLFSCFLLCRQRPSCASSDPVAPPEKKLRTPSFQFETTLLLAFSYGFWRYANEAETYILASVFVLGTWCFAVRGRWIWGVGVSVLGILVHLLNAVPLLLIIPLYYLLSKEWKKAVCHGLLTGLLVVAGYAVCSPWLDFSELGAQHHAAEGGITFSNLLRGGIAFGQNLVSANFLFGFESFRDLLSTLFPSRMLGEEFYMAQHMPGWIPWAGLGTVVALLGVGVWMCGKVAWECGSKCSAIPLSDSHQEGQKAPRRSSARRGLRLRGRSEGRKLKGTVLSRPPSVFGNHSSVINPLSISCLVWLSLYALAVIRTEAGSSELWIMALMPFWLLFAPLLKRRLAWLLVFGLFSHNLIAGLLPVMSAESDYHSQKADWLVEHTTEGDLVLTSYEPILIFYMNYYCPARLINSSGVSAERIRDELSRCSGDTYAFGNFFHPLESMKYRSPDMYDRMQQAGTQLFPMFGKIIEDDFGGIYCLRQSMDVEE